MKKLLVGASLCLLFSCGEQNTSTTDEYIKSELKTFEKKDSLENETRQFAEDYITAVNSADWKSEILKYSESKPDAFLREHTAFRKSFPNYQATIKHIMVDGNEAQVWINVTANYESTYKLDESEYGDEAIKGIEAKNQSLSWDETWYFDVMDGKFGEKWDFLKDNYAVLEGVGADKLP